MAKKRRQRSRSPGPEEQQSRQEEEKAALHGNARQSCDQIEIDSVDSLARLAIDAEALRAERRALARDAQAQGTMEEIAEDMLHIMEKLKDLTSEHEALGRQLVDLQRQLQESRRQHAVELDKLRRDLLAERKATAVRATFNAILPSLESLALMKDGLEGSEQIYAQLEAVIGSLRNIVQALGFVEFEVEVGSPFDPSRMECLGLVDNGEPNTVAVVQRPGYKVEDAVIRSCGVLVGQPPESSREGKRS